MMRYIVFDTETTGLDPFSGDKIIEIGAVEMFDKQRSGKTYRQLINPERPIPQEVAEITHITNEMVVKQPPFKDIINDFLNFLKSPSQPCEKTILVAHNAGFDIKFLNHQLTQEGMQTLNEFEIIDTLDLARRRFPGQKATLDMLCEKFAISLEERRKEGHGALLDSQILADVFVKLMEKTANINNQFDKLDFVGITHRTTKLERENKFTLSIEEKEQHKKFTEENNLNPF